MPPVARPLTDVLNSLPSEWKVHFHYSYFIDEDKMKSGDFGETKRVFEHTKDMPIDEKYLNYEIAEEFKHDSDLSRVKLEFHIKMDGVWSRKTSLNVSRDNYEYMAEKPRYNPADPSSLTQGYLDFIVKVKEIGGQVPTFEQYVQLHTKALQETNNAKQDPVTLTLLRQALKEKEDTVKQYNQKEALLLDTLKTVLSNQQQMLEYTSRREEKQTERADKLAEKLQNNAVAEAIKEAGVMVVGAADKLGTAQPGSPLDKIVNVALLSMTEKDAGKLAEKTIEIVGVKK